MAAHTDDFTLQILGDPSSYRLNPFLRPSCFLRFPLSDEGVCYSPSPWPSADWRASHTILEHVDSLTMLSFTNQPEISSFAQLGLWKINLSHLYFFMQQFFCSRLYYFSTAVFQTVLLHHTGNKENTSEKRWALVNEAFHFQECLSLEAWKILRFLIELASND